MNGHYGIRRGLAFWLMAACIPGCSPSSHGPSRGEGTPPPPVPSPGTYPAWRMNKSVDQAFEISGTGSMGGTTSAATTIDVWNGLGAGPTSWWSALAGGDGAPENAVISIDLAQDAPKWVLNHPTTSPDNYTLYGPYYLDGTPVARHTYWSTQYISAAHDRNGLDRVMVFSDYAAYGIFNGAYFSTGPQVDGFRVKEAQWDPAGTWQDTPFVCAPTSITKDLATEEVYLAGGYQFARWNPATGLFAEFFPTGPTKLLAWDSLPSLVDTKRHRLVAIHDGRPYYNVGFIRLQCIDLTTSTYDDLPVTGAITTIPGYGGAMVYDPDNDRYVFFTGITNQAYVINPATGASTLLATFTETVVHTMFGRAAYFPALGGIAYLPSFASNIEFLPTR